MRTSTVAGFLVGYLVLDWLSYIYPLQQSSITPWNPHPALAVALLALMGQRWLPAVFAVLVAAEVLVRQAPTGWPTTLLVAAVLTLGYAAMAAALAGFVSIRTDLANRIDVGRLVGVVTIGSLVTGVLYVGALWAAGAQLPGPYFETLLQFWVGDSVGILVTLPLVLMLWEPARRAELRALARQPVAWIQMASIALALWAVYGPVFAQPFKFFYLLFLPLIWIAVRFGLLGAVLAALAIQAGVIIASQTTEYSALTVFEMQALLIALTVTGLFLGVIVDERRQATQKLQESLRLAAAGEMSAALAHELNQPLTALTSYARAGMILADADGAGSRQQMRETLQNVLLEANRAGDVVRRLRDFFRTGATDLQLASLDEVASSVVQAMRSRAEPLGVTLEQETAEANPQVLIDRLQIEVVLRNLVANGVEAAASAPAPRSVRVEIGPAEAGFIRTIVRDTGAGVPTHVGDRVFEPFWSSRASGMGIGLAISRAIVEAHGGRLWAEAKGRGVFGFTLPVTHG